MHTILRTVAVGAFAIALLAANRLPQSDVPRIVVYPLTPYGAAQAADGERLATLIAQAVTGAGGVAVQPAPAGVRRDDYLDTAQRLGADYYMSGFVSSVAGRLAVVEQLVRTSSATLAWSNNVQVFTDNDMRAEGEVVRAAVLDLAHPSFVELRVVPKPAAPVAPTAPTAPATRAALPVALPAAVPATIAVLRAAGSASDDGKTYANAAIVAALRARGSDAASFAEPADELPILGPTLCASTGSKVVLGPTISIATDRDHLYGPWSTATINVIGYDCVRRRPLSVRSGTAGGYRWRWAIDQAADQIMKEALVERTVPRDQRLTARTAPIFLSIGATVSVA